MADNYKLEEFDPEILREYDIRGIFDKNLTTNTAYTIGRTFGHIVFLQSTTSKTIVVGYDGRLTSPKLHQALCKGIIESGIHVTSIGMCSSPMIYFAHHKLKTDAAVMVTGSHNPPEYNGFKMVLNYNSFFADKIQNLQELVTSRSLKTGFGNMKSFDILNDYVQRNLQNINIAKKLKIAWDIGNGAVGVVIDKFIQNLK